MEKALEGFPVFLKLLFYYLPFWAVFGIVVFVSVSLTLVLYFTLPFLSKKVAINDRQLLVVVTLIGVVGAFYSILFGLVNVYLWQNFRNVEDILSKEASDMSSILLNSAVLPDPGRAQIKQAVKTYVLAVRNDEWQKMHHGESSPQAWSAMMNLFTVLQTIQPATPYQTLFYDSVLSTLNDALSARRERIDALHNTIPSPLYRVLAVGSLLLIFFICYMAAKVGKRRHLLAMCIFVNCLIAFNLYLVLDLDNPFSGRIAIESTPFSEGILAEFQ